MDSLKRFLDEGDQSPPGPVRKQARIDIDMSGNKSESSEGDDTDP